MKEKIYGAYGSNMNLAQMKVRCPKAKVVGKGILENHKLTFRGRAQGVANVEKDELLKVPVVLWKITRECEEALDVYEGFPNLYIKRELEVLVENEKVQVMFYIMREEYEKMPAAPSERYFNIIAKGYMDNDIKLKTLQLAYTNCLLEVKGKI